MFLFYILIMLFLSCLFFFQIVVLFVLQSLGAEVIFPLIFLSCDETSRLAVAQTQNPFYMPVKT